MNLDKHKWTIGIAFAAAAFTLLAALLVLVALDRGAPAQVATVTGTGQVVGQRTVTVTGTADVKVAPDQVVITLGVETQDKDLGKAKSDNNRAVQEVVGAAKAHDISDDQVRTEYLQIDRQYSYTVLGAQVFGGYQVAQTISVTLSDVNEFENLLSALLEAGVTSVYSVEFQTSELRKYRDQARDLAIQAATEKSGALAGKLDQDLGAPLSIVEEQNTWRSWYGYGWGRYGGQSQNTVVEASSSPLEEGATIVPGQITVSATVTVTFELK